MEKPSVSLLNAVSNTPFPTSSDLHEQFVLAEPGQTFKVAEGQTSSKHNFSFLVSKMPGTYSYLRRDCLRSSSRTKCAKNAAGTYSKCTAAVLS
ncbi:TPA: hypothetical protein ACH3X1_010333 [Trebouxia sp. C0004]